MNNPPTEQILQSAMQFQRSGRLPEAEQGFRQVLAADPRNAQALNGLGNIALHYERLDDAAGLYSQAVSVNPSDLGYQSNLGTVLLKMGRASEAAQVFSRIVQLRPDYAEAYTNLGVALAEVGQFDQAIAAHRQAIALKPLFAMSYQNLGTVLRQVQRYPEAVEVLRRGLEVDPTRTEIYARLGTTYSAMGESDRARYHDAIDAYRRGLTINPDHPYLLTNMGVALSRLGKLEEAAAAHRRALEIYPNFPAGLMNLGVTLHNLGRFDEARQAYLHGLALDPNDSSLRGALSFTLLVQGDWEQGFSEYEKRLEQTRLYQRKWPQPQWDGSDPAGKTILVATEQGAGDTLHLIRYASLLADRGARVIVEAQEGLMPLVQRMRGVSEVVRQFSPLPAHDFYIPLGSLPHLFHTTPQNVPAPVPYLSPEPQHVAAWKQRFSQLGSEFKVGVAWAGNPKNRNDVHRSMLLWDLAPLAGVPGVKFFSLQVGPAAAQTLSAPPELKLEDLAPSLTTYEDTAAAISQLDLVISVDTSVVHVAGAMGRPVWNLLAFAPDWRWLLNRSDTPWYPTMRLFRQPRLGDWASVVAKVRDALTESVRR